MRKILSNQLEPIVKGNFDFNSITSFRRLDVFCLLVIYRRYRFSEC